MTRRVVVSDEAKTDLFGIRSWIAADNPPAAVRTVTRIASAIAGLADFSTGRAGRVAGTREKIVAGLPYVIHYDVSTIDSVETITILTVRHMARRPLS